MPRSSSGTRPRRPSAGERFARAIAAALLSVALAACTGTIAEDELPDDPIAFVRQAASEGILSMDQFREAARIETSDDETTRKPKLKTTLSLLSPSTGEFTPVPDATLGTLPFDWSADGSRLLVGKVDPVLSALDLYTWNRLSGAWVRVQRGPVGNGAGIADGPIRLVWHGMVREPNNKYSGAIWVDVDTQPPNFLVGSKGGAEPDVSPDGRTVVFSRAERESSLGPTIFMQTLGEPEPRPITRGSHPRYSRDGKWITFARKAEGNFDVWIMRADGSAKRPITSTSYDEEFPSLSADGRFVVYASSRGDEKESLLYITRVGDGAEREVVHNGMNTRPVW